MTAVYVGGFTLGQTIPGLNDLLDDVGKALQALAAETSDAVRVLGTAASALDGVANDLTGIAEGFVAGPFDAAQDAITAANVALDSLKGFVDIPSDYITGQIAVLESAIELLTTALDDAEEFLDNQIGAVEGAIGGLSDNLAELQGLLDDMLDVQSRISALTDGLRTLQSALDSAVDDAALSIAAWLEGLQTLSNAGVHLVHYNGPLEDLGTEVDAVLPGSNLPGAQTVIGPLLVCSTSNQATTEAIRAMYGIII